jgi:transcriptional regulator with XRE-family HTH domain
LARIRRDKGWTQEELVKRSGVGISQVRRYEKDNASPTLEIIVKLARTLGASIDELVFDKRMGVAADKILDRELLEQFEMVSSLEEQDRAAVKKVLEGMIVKHQVEKMITPRPESTWSRRFREISDKLAKGAGQYSQREIEEVIDGAVVAVRAKRQAHN